MELLKALAMFSLQTVRLRGDIIEFFRFLKLGIERRKLICIMLPQETRPEPIGSSCRKIVGKATYKMF